MVPPLSVLIPSDIPSCTANFNEFGRMPMDAKLAGSLCFLGFSRTLADASGKKNGDQKRNRTSPALRRPANRKSDVQGKRVAYGVDMGGSRLHKKKNNNK